MGSKKVSKEPVKSRPAEAEQDAEATKDLRDEELADDVDAILDEIDEVLESNAEEFIRGYIQKGGQ